MTHLACKVCEIKAKYFRNGTNIPAHIVCHHPVLNQFGQVHCPAADQGIVCHATEIQVYSEHKVSGKNKIKIHLLIHLNAYICAVADNQGSEFFCRQVKANPPVESLLR